MKKSDSWSKEKSDFSQNLNAFKKGTSDANTIIKQLDFLLSKNSLDNQSQQELIALISAAKLPQDFDKLLFNRLSDQQTRILQTPPPAKYFENPAIDHSNSQLSSLPASIMQAGNAKQAPPIKSGQIIRGNYQLEVKIGSGGMGQVWKALDLIQDAGEAKDRYVAIKFINREIRSHPYALKALVREFSRYKKLIHPNIVKAYELNGDENEVFIAMEYLVGSELKDFIKQNPQGIPLQQAQPIIKAMCDALDYAHQEGIIHLDFKPGNVFYNPDTQDCKVIDFGIARLSNREARDETLFDPGSLGAMTTAYASSEMLMESEPDIKDDIYSLACVVYELLSGHHPFNKCLSLKAEREKMKPKQISGLKKDEFQALLHGLCFHRDKRTSSASEFYSELFSPQQVASQKRTKWFIIGSIILTSLTVVPFVAYQSYNNWQLNQVSASIEQKISSAINDFTSLSVDGQQELLDKPSFRVDLVEYIVAQHGTSDDILNVIAQFNPVIQRRFFADRKVRDTLISYYNKKVDLALANDDFQQAEQLSRHILQQYPDSMRLVGLSNSIEPKKSNRIVSLQKDYQQCLADNTIGLTKLFPCFQKNRALLAKIDKVNALRQLPVLTSRYYDEISAAIKGHKLREAETLLSHWHSLEKNDINKRTQLVQKLAYVKKRDELIQQIIDSNHLQLTKIINLFPSLPATLIKDVLSQSSVKRRILDFYHTTITQHIADKKFSAATAEISAGISLFPKRSKEQNKLKQLAQKNGQKKNAYLNLQKALYQQQLSQAEPEITIIQNIQKEVSVIAPENPLIQLPDLSKSYTKKIDAAMGNNQYALAQRLLDNWKILKPADAHSSQFIQLTDKKAKLSLGFAVANKASLQLQTAIKGKQLSEINTLIKGLKTQFSEYDLGKIMAPYKEQLINVYQQQIDTTVQQDSFDLALQVASQIQSILPKNRQVLAMSSNITKAKKIRINKLLSESRNAINTETLNAVAIFSPLLIIQTIDSDYLNNHLNIFQDIGKKLTTIIGQDKTLPQLKNINIQWGEFISTHDQATENIKQHYRKTNRLIALRCLIKGRIFRKQKNEIAANELFMFGLSLDPGGAVKKALEQDILQ